jgi:Integrase core domain
VGGQRVHFERLWRSLKHEDIYLKGYADGGEAKAGIGAWFAIHNSARPHQALGNRMPMAVWREGTTGDFGEMAVDMTLRLDNARALPHTHSRHSSKRLSRSDDFNKTERPAFQLTDRPQWSYRLGPPHSPRLDTAKNWLFLGTNRRLLRLRKRGIGDGGIAGIF